MTEGRDAGTSGFAGRTVGAYAIADLVGAGGMGEVYRAHDTRLDRRVAIKVLPRVLATEPTARARFLRETRLASKVVHPYVATVFDVVESGDDLLLVMEYLEGRTLRDFLREERPAAARVAEIGIEIAEALDAIHTAGVVHRDLKPANVMIAPSGHVKVMDFGVARGLDGTHGAGDPTLTREGVGVGTVLYMSPEQVRGRKIDARSDLFALGGLLWEAISGEHPFSRETVVETATAILREPPGGGTEPPSLTQSGALRDVILRLLRKDPDERYASAEAVVEDLRAVLRGDRPTRTDLMTRLHRRRAVRTTALTFVAGALATVAIVVAVTQRLWIPSDARPLVAVLPFETREAGGDETPFMTADLVASLLGDGATLRAAPVRRVEELLAPMGGGGSRGERARKVHDVLAPRWIVAATLYREGEFHLASVEILDGRSLASLAPFQVRAERASALAAAIAARIPEAVGAAEAGASPPETARILPRNDRALARYAEARRLERRMDWTGARAALEAALAIEPDYLDALNLLADVLGRMGYERDAHAAIRDAERIAREAGLGDDAPQRLETRAIAGRLSGPEDEVRALAALVARRPDEVDLRVAHAGALRRAGRVDDALAEVDRAIAIDPEDGRAHLARAEILRRLGRGTDAVASADRADRIFERDEIPAGRAEVAEWRALVAWFDDRLEDAARLYEGAAGEYDAIGLPARAAGARQYVADAYLLLRDERTARDLYRRIVPVLDAAGHYRRAATVRNSLAASLLQEGAPDEAEQAFVEALDRARALGLEDHERYPLTNLAYVRSQTGRAEEAIDLADRALAIAERQGPGAQRCGPLLIRGIAKAQAGARVDGVADLESVASDEGCPGTDRVDALNWASWFGSVFEDPGAALAYGTRALDLVTKVGVPAQRVLLLADQARVLADLGDVAAARDHLRSALELGGPDALARRESAPLLRLAEAATALAAGDTNAIPGPDGDERYGSPAWIRLVRAEARFAAGDARGALALADEILRDPWFPRAGRAHARALAATAAIALDDRVGARALATEAVDEAASLSLALSEARACAVLAVAPGGSESTATWTERGRRALDRYLDRVPAGYRESIRARRDVAELSRVLNGRVPDGGDPRGFSG